MTAKAAALQAGVATVALPKVHTTAECREIVAKAFKEFGDKSLPSLVGVENYDLPVLDRVTTDRTILSIAVTALNAAGIQTDSTVGAVRGRLGMDQDDIDYAFCECFNGTAMTGNQAAAFMGDAD